MNMKLLFLLGITQAQAPLEPAGKIFLGGWLDYQQETPNQFNEKLGFDLSFYQMAENFPLNFTDPPPFELLNDTNAILMMTVYPQPGGLGSISDDDIAELVKQIAGRTKAGRRVFLRLAPEMNGGWFVYGQQPTAFINFWKRTVDAFRREPLTKDKIAFVWGPNHGFGYPYPGGEFSIRDKTSRDFQLLDTNKNGELDVGDDPYTPYYPGDDYVDWVGLSIYYFGPRYPWIDNALPPRDAFDMILRGRNGNADFDFYQTFAVGRNKPMLIPETSAAFHKSFLADPTAILAPGPGELAIKQAFWSQYITNKDFPKTYPKIKGIGFFEFLKSEELTMRDFRISNDATLNAFKADFEKVKDNYATASKNQPGSPIFPGSDGSAESYSPRTMAGLVFSLALIVLIL